MPIHFVQVLAFICAAGACAGIVYNVFCLRSARKFAHQRGGLDLEGKGRPGTPPVSILKPLRGTDPEMYESFRSHCLVDYPEYEILFAVHDPNDPAVTLVEKLNLEFPERKIRLLVFPKALGANIKVSNLAQMAPLAQYEYLLVNDSDIRVEQDYLRRIMAPFVDEQVGMVTCLYRGVAARTIGSELEALGISTDFCAGVLMAQVVEGEIRFGLGSTMALRKHDLEGIGGFDTIVDYLADDYELGARIAASGKRVHIADPVVETFLPAYSWRDFARHQLRWARGIRDSRPWGYMGLALTHALPWAVLTVLLARGTWWAWILLGIALTVRLTAAFVVGESVLGDKQVRKLWWLIPLRDCLALILWAAAYAGRTVYWRGDRFLLKKGKLERAGSPVSSRLSTSAEP